MSSITKTTTILTLGIIALLTAGCGGAAGPDAIIGPGPQAATRAQFTFDCDLQGVNGVLTLGIEVVNTAGPVFGNGPNPVITGVIGTGDVIYYTAGDLVSPVSHYVFTGENDFAEFTNLTVPESFLVQWVPAPQGLTLVANPFGPGPTQYSCIETSAVFR